MTLESFLHQLPATFTSNPPPETSSYATFTSNPPPETSSYISLPTAPRSFAFAPGIWLSKITILRCHTMDLQLMNHGRKKWRLQWLWGFRHMVMVASDAPRKQYCDARNTNLAEIVRVATWSDQWHGKEPETLTFAQHSYHLRPFLAVMKCHKLKWQFHVKMLPSETKKGIALGKSSSFQRNKRIGYVVKSSLATERNLSSPQLRIWASSVSCSWKTIQKVRAGGVSWNDGLSKSCATHTKVVGGNTVRETTN